MRLISASSYSDYILCPLIYKYKYIESYQEIFSIKTDEINKGNKIHKLIDAYSKDIVYPDSYINEDHDVKKAFEYYIKNYNQKNANTFNEYVFNVPLNTEYEKVILTGRIDQITFNENNIIVTDWKTTIRKTKLSILDSKLQTDFYAYTISKISNIDFINVRLVYLNLEHEDNFIINKQELKDIELKITDFINNTNPLIKNHVPNPLELTKGKYICEICSFYNLCQDFI